MKKKGGLLMALVLLVSMSMLACGGVSVKTFDAQEKIDVEINTEFSVPIINITDSKDSVIATTIKVTQNSDNTEVELTNGKFVASQKAGYVITYSATVGDESVSKKTKINVIDTTVPEISLANSEAGELIVLGGATKLKKSDVIAKDNSQEKPIIKYEVKFGDEAVAVTADTFTAEKEGKYTVKYIAEDASGNSNSVEKDLYTKIDFGTEKQISSFKKRGNIEFSINKEANYILRGATSAKATIAAGSSWPMIYWENLGDISGASSVSFYIYNNGVSDQNIWLNMQETLAQGKRTLKAKMWNLIEIPAADFATIFITKSAEGSYPAYGGTHNATISIHFGDNMPLVDLYFQELMADKNTAKRLTLSVGAIETAKLNTAYNFPAITVKGSDAQAVTDATLTYIAYDDAYNALAVDATSFVPITTDSYLIVKAQKDSAIGFIKIKITALSKAANEIEFFENATGLANFTASYNSKITYEQENTASAQSLGAMKFDPFVGYSNLTFNEGIGNASLANAATLNFDVYIVDPTNSMDSTDPSYVAETRVVFELGTATTVTESNKWVRVSITIPDSFTTQSLVGKQLMIMSYVGTALADKNPDSGSVQLDKGFMFIFDNFSITRKS